MKSDYKWEEILRNCIKNNTIKSSYLQHIPKLKDCENWQEVIFIGRVHYQFKLTTIDGGLVKNAGKLYYINAKQMMTLASFYKWPTERLVSVIE